MEAEGTSVNAGARRLEDIALDMMKFIAITTGYGKAGPGSTGFQGAAPIKADEYASNLLELYGKCLTAVRAK